MEGRHACGSPFPFSTFGDGDPDIDGLESKNRVTPWVYYAPICPIRARASLRQGLLSELKRKNGRQMVEALGEASPYGTQLLRTALGGTRAQSGMIYRVYF